MRLTILVILIVILEAALGFGGYIYVQKQNDVATERVVTSERQANEEVARLSHQLEFATNPPDVVTNIIEPDVTSWKTYTLSGATFRYPSNWSIVPQVGTSLFSIVPTRYLSTFQHDIATIKKATPIPLMVSCGTSEESLTTFMEKLKHEDDGVMTTDGRRPHRNFQTLTLASGTAAQFYTWDSLYSTVQYYETQKDNTRCSWSIMKPSESPLTKEEDGIAFRILNTFQFAK